MDTIEHKTCTGCQEIKPLAAFSRRRTGGHLTRCRTCRSATRKAWRGTYREKQAAYRRRFQLSVYGLTEEEYDTMLAAQGGGCAMCGKECSTGRQLAVDHDHQTGRVRALLCVKCNQWLGVYEAVGTAAREYLVVYGAGNPHISHGEALKTKRRAPRVGTSRLTEDDVRSIRQRYARGGVTQRVLAAEYGMSQNAIGLILRGKTWQHVDMPIAMNQAS